LLRDFFAKSTKLKNPYNYYGDQKDIQDKLRPAFQSQPDSAVEVLSTTRPNVVIIMLESFVGDLIQSLGGEKGITPHMEELIKGGILFDHIYSAADRSDKGMVAVLSGFPAQGPESI